MATKLVSLQIDHVAGVDRPANKRKFLIVKQERIAKMSIKKEGDKFCLYDGEEKVGEYESEEAAQAAKEKMMKGATMLTKEQIVKIENKEVQEAVLKQQEDMLALEKQAKTLEEELVKARAGNGANDDDEELWKGISPAIRNRFEAIRKERDDMQATAKHEKDAREESVWIGKIGALEYINTDPRHFGKTMRILAENNPIEAEEVHRVLTAANVLLSKGVIFSEFGKSRNGKHDAVGPDATNVVARVDGLANDYLSMNKDLTKPAAIEKVFKEHPDWYEPYRRESATRI